MRMVNLFLLKILEIFSNFLIDRASGITQIKLKSFSSFNWSWNLCPIWIDIYQTATERELQKSYHPTSEYKFCKK